MAKHVLQARAEDARQRSVPDHRPRGGNTGDEVTSIKGRPLPPTPKPGYGYGKPDKTK